MLLQNLHGQVILVNLVVKLYHYMFLLPLFIFADRKYKCVKPVNKGDDDRSFLTLTTRGHLTATRAHLLSRPFNIWMPNWLGGWLR